MSPFEDVRSAAISPADNAQALPFYAYSDAAFFDLEMERAFARDWVAVCASAELGEPGACLALSIGREPVVVVRDEAGQLRALSNVCRHRGTILQDEGFGKIDKFVCPYHAWSYSLEGKLRGVPMSGSVKVDRDQHCLPNFQVDEWAGVIFVNLDPQAESLGSVLSGIDPYLEPFAIETYDTVAKGTNLEEWRSNWKLIVENAMESYHLFKVHEKTLETVTPTKGAYLLEGSARWTVTAGYYAGVEPNMDESHPTADLAENRGYVLVSIPPSFVGILTSDSWAWLIARPVAPDQSVVAASALRQGAPGILERLVSGDSRDEFVKAFFAEDKFICERGQRGMASRRSQGGQLVELERVVVDFHHYLAWRLFDEAPPSRWQAGS